MCSRPKFSSCQQLYTWWGSQKKEGEVTEFFVLLAAHISCHYERLITYYGAITPAVIAANLSAKTAKNGSRRSWWRLFRWIPIRRSLQAGWNGFVKSTKPITWPAAASVGTNADHRLQHRPTWNLEDPWTHRETVLACASPEANQFRSLILRLRRYELSIQRIYLVSLLSRARLLKSLWRPESTVAFFVVSQEESKDM